MSDKEKVEDSFLQQHISCPEKYIPQKGGGEVSEKFDLWTRWDHWIKAVRG